MMYPGDGNGLNIWFAIAGLLIGGTNAVGTSSAPAAEGRELGSRITLAQAASSTRQNTVAERNRKAEDARAAHLAQLEGVWKGHYRCPQGRTGVTLTVDRPDSRGPTAHFYFFPLPENPTVPEGEILYGLRYNLSAQVINLRVISWVKQPRGFNAVPIQLRLSDSGKRLHGTVRSRECGEIVLDRISDTVPLAQQRPQPESEPDTNEVADSKNSQQEITRSSGSEKEQASSPSSQPQKGKTASLTERKLPTPETKAQASLGAKPKTEGTAATETQVNVEKAAAQRANSGAAPFSYSAQEAYAMGDMRRKEFTQKADLSGYWEGLARCGDGWHNFSMNLVPKEGGYEVESRHREVSTFFLNLNRKGTAYPYVPEDRVATKDFGSMVSSLRRIHPLSSRPFYLEFGGYSPCRGYYLRQFSPMGSLSGEYAKWKNFSETCTGVRTWMGTTAKQKTIAQALKTSYPKLLGSYDAESAHANALLDDDLLSRFFGTTVEKMTAHEKQHLLQLVSDCYILRANSADVRRETYHLLTASRLEEVVRELSWRAAISFSAESAVVTAAEIDNLAELARRSKVARQKIAELLPVGGATEPDSSLEARVSAASQFFNDVSPEFLHQHLDPPASQITRSQAKKDRIARMENTKAFSGAEWQFFSENYWNRTFIHSGWRCSKGEKIYGRTEITVPFVFGVHRAHGILPGGLTPNTLLEGMGCDTGVNAVNHVETEYILPGYNEKLEKCAGCEVVIGRSVITFDRRNDVKIIEEIDVNINPDVFRPVPDDPVIQLALLQYEFGYYGSMPAETKDRYRALRDEAVRRGSRMALDEVANWINLDGYGSMDSLSEAKPYWMAAIDAGSVSASLRLAEAIDARIGEDLRSGRPYDRELALEMFRSYAFAASHDHYKAISLLDQYRELGFEVGAEGFVDREEPNSIEVQTAINSLLEKSCDLTQLAGASGALGPFAAIVGVSGDAGGCTTRSFIAGGSVSFGFGRVSNLSCNKISDGQFGCRFMAVLACYSTIPLPSGFAGFSPIGGTATCPPPWGQAFPFAGIFRKSASGFEWAGKLQ